LSEVLVTDSGVTVTDAAVGSLSKPLTVSRPSDSERVIDSSANIEIVHANGCVTVNEIQLTPLKYVDVFVSGRRLKALVDSGCECPLVDSKVLAGDAILTIRNIWIQPIVGPAVPVKLAALDVAQFVNESALVLKESKPLHLVFAVLDNLVGHEVVLPASIADELMQTSQHCYSQPCINATSAILVKSQLEDIQCNDDSDVTDDYATNVDSTVTSQTVTIQTSGETMTEVKVTTDGSTVVNRATDVIITANSDVLAAEQTNDDSLNDCRALARNKA